MPSVSCLPGEFADTNLLPRCCQPRVRTHGEISCDLHGRGGFRRCRGRSDRNIYVFVRTMRNLDDMSTLNNDESDRNAMEFSFSIEHCTGDDDGKRAKSCTILVLLKCKRHMQTQECAYKGCLGLGLVKLQVVSGVALLLSRQPACPT